MDLTAEQLRGLAVLDNVGPQGCPETLLLAHGGLTTEMIARLVRDGLASAHPEPVPTGGDIARIRITDAGRRALGSCPG
jgi:hypothetical protein